MATSGSTDVTITSYDTMRLSWTLNSQNTTNNTSNITFTATLIAASNGGRINSSASKSYTATINGTSYSGTNTVGISNGATKTLFTKTLDITHDSDGSKSFTFTYKQEFSITFSSVWRGTYSGSITVNPTTIARASTITSASNVTLGNTCSVKWTPMSSSFTYKLKFTIGSTSYTTGTISPNTTSAYTYTGYTMSISDWASSITSSTTATCTVVLYTYSGSSQIGSTSSKTFTVTVPTSVTPSVSIATAEGNSAITIGVYVQGMSKVTVTSTATQAYGSSINSYAVKVGDVSYSGSNITSSTLLTAGNISVSVTITDARGRTATASTTITVQEYSVPSISTFIAQRCLTDGTLDANGESVRIQYAYSISSLSNKNTCSMSIKYKRNSESSYGSTVTSGTNTSASSVITTANSFNTETSYDFQITVTDLYNTTTKTVALSTSLYPLSVLHTGTGIAFGKVAEVADLCDIGWNTRIRGGLTVDEETSLNELKINGAVDSQLNVIANSNPVIKATNINTNYATKILAEAPSGYQVWLGVGSDGINRGIYDPMSSKWIVYADSVNDTYLSYANGTYKPYYEAGDSIGSTTFTSAGFVNGTSNVYFTIPLDKPVLGSPSVEVTITNMYVSVNGSLPYSGVTPSSVSADIVYHGLRVTATMDSVMSGYYTAGISANIAITFI